MKTKVCSMVLAICIIFSLVAVFPVTATEDKIIAICDEKTVVDVLTSYSNAYNTQDGSATLGADGINVIVRPNDWMEFTVNVDEAGYYKLEVNCAVYDYPYHLWKAYVDDVEQTSFYTWYMSGTTWEQEVGDMYLPAGRHTLKFKNVGTRWNYFTQFSLTKKLNQAKSIFVFAQDYETGFMADGVTALPLDTGRVVLHTNSWAEYKVNVPTAGKYYMALQNSWNWHSAVPVITVNGTDVTGLKMHESYFGESDRAYATSLSPTAYIDLNQGENTIKITNTGNDTMLRGFKLERIAEGVGFAIQADNYKTVTGSTRVEAGCVVLNDNSSVSYDINVPSDGLYSVAVEVGGSEGGSAGYSLYADGEYLGTENVTFKNWKAMNLSEIFAVDLKAGQRTLTIKTSILTSGHYLRNILLEKIAENSLEAEKTVKIEDDYKTAVAAKDYVKSFNKSTLSTAPLNVTENGNIILTPLTKAKYCVDVPVDGVYTLSFKYATEANRNIMQVKVDGKSVLSPRLQYATEEGMLTVELGDLKLKKGNREIEIINSCYENNLAPNIYINEFYFEKKVLDRESKWFWAADYSAQRDAGGSAISQEGNFLSFQCGDEVDYQVRIHEAGIYRLDIMSGSGSTNYEVKVDGEVMDWLGTSLTKRYTGGLENQVPQPICELYFASEGLYTITIKNIGEGQYLSKIKLSPVDSLEIPSLYYMATDYVEASNADANASAGESENVMPVEGGNVKFGVGDSITYDASTFEDGYYRILMLGSHGDKNVINNISIGINGQEATHGGQYEGSGNWDRLNVCDLGLIFISGGNNTITLKTTAGTTVYFYALIIEPVSNIPTVTKVAGDYADIDLQTTLKASAGTTPMITGGFSSIKISGDNTAAYDLDIVDGGKYNVFVTTDISKEICKDITVKIGDSSSNVSVANSAASALTTFKAGTFTLAKGEVPVEITANSNDFVLAKVSIEKAEDIEIDVIKKNDNKTIMDNTLTNGNFAAKVSFNNGKYDGESVICTFVVYKTDANGIKKIDKIASQTVEVSDNQATLNIDGIAFEEGMTYSAVVYAWNANTLYGISKVF